SNILHKHNGLIGVLLHYGRNNAWNFYQREQLFKCKDASFEIENKIQMLNKKLLMFAPHDYDDIEKILEETDDHDSDEFTYLYLLPQYMTLPVFSADPYDNETKQLKHEYEESRKKVQSIYLNKIFLEETLKQIVFG
nr:hypothetical protein [Candidatus Anoxychlamydiales bacterium]